MCRRAVVLHMHENNRKFPFWLQKWQASAKYRTDGKRYFVPFVTGMHRRNVQFGKTHNSCIGHQHHVVLHRRDLHEIASFGHFIQHWSHWFGTSLPLWRSGTLWCHVGKVLMNLSVDNYYFAGSSNTTNYALSLRQEVLNWGRSHNTPFFKEKKMTSFLFIFKALKMHDRLNRVFLYASAATAIEFYYPCDIWLQILISFMHFYWRRRFASYMKP